MLIYSNPVIEAVNLLSFVEEGMGNRIRRQRTAKVPERYLNLMAIQCGASKGIEPSSVIL